MSQSPLIDQLLLEERQREERELYISNQAALLGGVFICGLISLHTPSWLWFSAGFAAAWVLWRWRGSRFAAAIIGRRLRKRGVWSDETLIRAASAVAYAAHQSVVNANGSRHIDHASRVVRELEGNPTAVAVGWLHAVVDHAPVMEAEVRTFPPDIVAAVMLLTLRNAPTDDAYLAGIESNALASRVYRASEKVIAERKELTRRNRERAAQHELTVGPRESAVVVYEEAA